MSRFAVYENRNHKFRLLDHFETNEKAQKRATARNIQNYESGNADRNVRVVPCEEDDPPRVFEAKEDMVAMIQENNHLFPRSW